MTMVNMFLNPNYYYASEDRSNGVVSTKKQKTKKDKREKKTKQTNDFKRLKYTSKGFGF